MQLTYASHYKHSISAILDAGETLGNLGSPDEVTYNFIRVDGHDPNYLALLEEDPTLETVIDPLAPIVGAAAPGTTRGHERRETRSENRKHK